MSDDGKFVTDAEVRALLSRRNVLDQRRGVAVSQVDLTSARKALLLAFEEMCRMGVATSPVFTAAVAQKILVQHNVPHTITTGFAVLRDASSRKVVCEPSIWLSTVFDGKTLTTDLTGSDTRDGIILGDVAHWGDHGVVPTHCLMLPADVTPSTDGLSLADMQSHALSLSDVLRSAPYRLRAVLDRVCPDS